VREAQIDVPFAAFCLYVMVVISNFARLGDITIGTALLGLLFVRGKRAFPLPLLLLALFVSWGTLTLMWTSWPDAVKTSVEAYWKIFLIVLVAANVLRTPGRIRFFIFFLLALYAYYPVRGALFSQFIYHAATLGRIGWNHIFSNPNDLAALLFLPLGLASGVLLTERLRVVRWCALAGVILIPLIMFLTQSRGGLLGLAAFGLAMLRHVRLHPRTIGLLAVGAVVIALLAPRDVWTRMANLTKATDAENLSTLGDRGSAAQRIELWKVGRRIIADHTAAGVGLGAYPFTHAIYARQGAETLQNRGIAWGRRDVHSTYLHVTAETGVVGAALFFSIFIAVLSSAERIRRRLRKVSPPHAGQLYALEASLVAFFVAGIFGSFTMITFTYLHAIVLWALGNAHARLPAQTVPEVVQPARQARRLASRYA
jgi:hypothetical protein